MNYELTDHSIILKNGTVLHQIRALKDIPNCPPNGVTAGALGGFIEGEHNLSQDDQCFVFYPAQVLGNCRISGCNQIGGTVRACPEGLHGFGPFPLYITGEKMIESMLGDIPDHSPTRPMEPPARLNRFQILKNEQSY
jgi:hypothetical protein